MFTDALTDDNANVQNQLQSIGKCKRMNPTQWSVVKKPLNPDCRCLSGVDSDSLLKLKNIGLESRMDRFCVT